MDVRIVRVNYDDPCWMTLAGVGRYYHRYEDPKPEDFPVRKAGVGTIICQLEMFRSYTSYAAIVAWQIKDGFRAPERAEAETYLIEHPAYREDPASVVALCGEIIDYGGKKQQAILFGSNFGIALDVQDTNPDSCLNRVSLLLRVKSI